MKPRRGSGPSATEIKLKSDLDRARRELQKLKKESQEVGVGAEAGGTAGPDLEKLQAHIENLERTRKRLGSLYVSQQDEIRRRSLRLDLVLSLVSEMNVGLELPALLEQLGESVRASLGFSMVLVRVRDPEQPVLRVMASTGVPPEALATLGRDALAVEEVRSWMKDEFKVSRSYYFSHRNPFSRVLPAGYVPTLGHRDEWEWQAEDVLFVPLHGSEGELLGTIGVDDPVDRLVPSRDTVQLLEIFGLKASLAIQNLRWFRKLEQRAQDLEQGGSRLDELTRLKGHFAAALARELGTPLASIRAYVEALRFANPDALQSRERQGLLRVIDEEATRLKRLLGSLVDLQRLGPSDDSDRIRPVELAEVLEEGICLLRPMADAAQVNLKVVNELADTHLESDRDRMRQLVLQLGSYAVQSTPAGGRVTFQLTGDERSVRLQVEDTGIGIAEKELERIFDRSDPAKAEERRSSAESGLAVCKSIVETHGGQIVATSTTGQGSCFTVVLQRKTTRGVVLRASPLQRTTTQDLMRLAVEMVAEVMNARVVSLMAREGDDLLIQAAIGLEEKVVRGARVRPGQGVSGWVAQQRRPVCVAQTNDRDNKVQGSGNPRYRSGTFLSVPLEDSQGLLGVLNVTDPLSGAPFEPEDCTLLLDLSERIAAAWNKAQALEESRNEVADTTAALRQVLEHFRHGQTLAPNRVRLAQALAQELGLSPEEMSRIGFAAMVHDVGMTLVSQDVLSQGGPLTPQQKAEVQRHVELGANLLHTLESMGEVREIVLSHHEWWDGSGYPRKLRGSQIPLGGRVIAVVDAFESMTQGRSHRPPQSRESARLEIQRLKGRQFDPEVVEALERVLDRAPEPRSAATHGSMSAADSDARR